jgi:hypothetical protein
MIVLIALSICLLGIIIMKYIDFLIDVFKKDENGHTLTERTFSKVFKTN